MNFAMNTEALLLVQFCKYSLMSIILQCMHQLQTSLELWPFHPITEINKFDYIAYTLTLY